MAEPAGELVRETLAGAELVVASDLTLVECDRALVRGAATGVLVEIEAARRRARLEAAAARWVVLRLARETIERARRPLPAEPLRTLDALHLASALMARAAVPGLALLSLDERVRASGQGLGFGLLPAR